MPDSRQRTRLTRSRRARLTAGTLLIGALVAGCGGSSPSVTSTGVGRENTSASTGASTTTGSNTATNAGAARSRSTKSGAYGSGPLAFAKCMRANGAPDFPDPTSGRSGRVPVGDNPAGPSFFSAQSKCQKLVPGSGFALPGATTHPSAKTMATLVRIAKCMRQHGVPQFPDPRTSVPSSSQARAYQEITDYDNAILLFPRTINMQAPAYRHALIACGAPPLGLPH